MGLLKAGSYGLF